MEWTTGVHLKSVKDVTFVHKFVLNGATATLQSVGSQHVKIVNNVVKFKHHPFQKFVLETSEINCDFIFRGAFPLLSR